jgi:hypothetical protein
MYSLTMEKQAFQQKLAAYRPVYKPPKKQEAV